jgi:hypothetical protein
MRTRNINFRGKPISGVAKDIADARERLKQRFANDSDTLTKFLDYILMSGWTEDDISSTATQYSTDYRPSVDAALIAGGGGLIDVLLLSQGRFTSFQDTASDPNWAMRFKAEAELLFRRQSPGDLMLQQEALRISATAPTLDGDSPEYWKRLTNGLFRQLYLAATRKPSNTVFAECLDDPFAALSFLLKYYMANGREHSLTLLREYTDTRSPLHIKVGCSFSPERVRQPDDTFVRDAWVFDRRDNPNAWRAAAVTFGAAIDCTALEHLAYQYDLEPSYQFIDHLASTFGTYRPVRPQFREDFHAIPEADHVSEATRTRDAGNFMGGDYGIEVNHGPSRLDGRSDDGEVAGPPRSEA